MGKFQPVASLYLNCVCRAGDEFDFCVYLAVHQPRPHASSARGTLTCSRQYVYSAANTGIASTPAEEFSFVDLPQAAAGDCKEANRERAGRWQPRRSDSDLRFRYAAAVRWV